MRTKSLMLIAGEPSGDALAAELVGALRTLEAGTTSPPQRPDQPWTDRFETRCFGAGGPRMAEAGVDLAFDMTRHSVIGLWEAIKEYRQFNRLFNRLLRLALDRQPDVIVGVDFSGFNRRFAAAVKSIVRSRRSDFYNWNPKLVQFVSPQVWASRPGRARQMARSHDLVLGIFPFEPEWYASHAPTLPILYVGHPMLDRHAGHHTRPALLDMDTDGPARERPCLVLLPGSRAGELNRHLPVMLGALPFIRQAHPEIRVRMIVPDPALARLAAQIAGAPPASDLAATLPHDIELSVGHLAQALAEADLAIASTGTVTMECAYFGVATVAIYKTSWSTYQIGRRIIRVKYLAMPNLIAGRELFPELIQHEATPERIARETLALLDQPGRRRDIRKGLREVIDALGPPGAIQRAAQAVESLLVR